MALYKFFLSAPRCVPLSIPDPVASGPTVYFLSSHLFCSPKSLIPQLILCPTEVFIFTRLKLGEEKPGINTSQHNIQEEHLPFENLRVS